MELPPRPLLAEANRRGRDMIRVAIGGVRAAAAAVHAKMVAEPVNEQLLRQTNTPIQLRCDRVDQRLNEAGLAPSDEPVVQGDVPDIGHEWLDRPMDLGDGRRTMTTAEFTHRVLRPVTLQAMLVEQKVLECNNFRSSLSNIAVDLADQLEMLLRMDDETGADLACRVFIVALVAFGVIPASALCRDGARADRVFADPTIEPMPILLNQMLQGHVTAARAVMHIINRMDA